MLQRIFSGEFRKEQKHQQRQRSSAANDKLGKTPAQLGSSTSGTVGSIRITKNPVRRGGESIGPDATIPDLEDFGLPPPLSKSYHIETYGCQMNVADR